MTGLDGWMVEDWGFPLPPKGANKKNNNQSFRLVAEICLSFAEQLVGIFPQVSQVFPSLIGGCVFMSSQEIPVIHFRVNLGGGKNWRNLFISLKARLEKSGVVFDDGDGYYYDCY